MLQYVCDWCKRIKKANDHWILAFAVEKIAATTHTTEVAVCSHWSAASAADALAVHFCSEQHKNAYMGLLFDAPAKRRTQRGTHGAPTVSNPSGRAAHAPQPLSLDVELDEEHLAAPPAGNTRAEPKSMKGVLAKLITFDLVVSVFDSIAHPLTLRVGGSPNVGLEVRLGGHLRCKV